VETKQEKRLIINNRQVLMR